MGQVLRKLLEVFYTKKLDIVVIGLENRYEKTVRNYEAATANFVESCAVWMALFGHSRAPSGCGCGPES